jgi:hypothetical protein
VRAAGSNAMTAGSSPADSWGFPTADTSWAPFGLCATPVCARAIFTITRNPSAGMAAAIQPSTDRSASTTWAPSDSTTATANTDAGKPTGIPARFRRRNSKPDAIDISSRTTASPHASHPS